MPRGRDRPTLPSDFRQPWRPRAGGLHVAAARRAADAAGVPMFLNARTDTYLRAVGDPATRLRETLARAAAYAEAGADGIFVPGVTDPDIVAALAAADGLGYDELNALARD
jgi:2-hydroxychromene-2-carboxylate isomerase